MIYHFSFAVPARYSELLLSNMEANQCIVEDVISRKLCGCSPLMIVQNVRLKFVLPEYQYLIGISINRLGKTDNDEESMEAHIESLIAEALQELFGEVIDSL